MASMVHVRAFPPPTTSIRSPTAAPGRARPSGTSNGASSAGVQSANAGGEALSWNPDSLASGRPYTREGALLTSSASASPGTLEGPGLEEEMLDQRTYIAKHVRSMGLAFVLLTGLAMVMELLQ
jgi:hypothetical protein